MDEGAAIDRARATRGEQANLTVRRIDAQVIADQVQQRTDGAGPGRRDPSSELAATYQYRVAPYDVLSVIVWDHPELTIPAGEYRSAEATGHPVMADGTMYFPHVGVVDVGGKTLPEIRAVLTQRLSKYVANPQLDVRIAAFRGKKVQVTGEVTAPSTVAVTDVPLRVLDALHQAKGATADGDLERVVLTRDGKAHLLNLQRANETGNLAENWLLQDGDLLHVPDRRLQRIFVIGEVKQPAARVLPRGALTLADALSDAQWVDPVAANMSHIYVLRGDYMRPDIFRLDAGSADAMLLAAQFELKPRDVVFVSTTGLAQRSRVVAQILPTVQALWQTYDLTTRLLPTRAQ